MNLELWVKNLKIVITVLGILFFIKGGIPFVIISVIVYGSLGIILFFKDSYNTKLIESVQEMKEQNHINITCYNKKELNYYKIRNSLLYSEEKEQQIIELIYKKFPKSKSIPKEYYMYLLVLVERELENEKKLQEYSKMGLYSNELTIKEINSINKILNEVSVNKLM